MVHLPSTSTLVMCVSTATVAHMMNVLLKFTFWSCKGSSSGIVQVSQGFPKRNFASLLNLPNFGKKAQFSYKVAETEFKSTKFRIKH